MFHTMGLRIPPVIGAVLGLALMAIGITSGLVSLAIAGAVVVAAAMIRLLAWR